MSYKFDKLTTKVMRDKSRRDCFMRYELQRNELRAIARDSRLSAEIRQSAKAILMKRPVDGSPTRIVNRCTVTGRNRGVSKRFKMSRRALRGHVSKGLLPGVHKASW